MRHHANLVFETAIRPKRVKPLVSCICITQNRRLFLRQAVQYFERARSKFLQNCPKGEGWCELIVLDGSEASSEKLRINDGNYGDGLFLGEVAGLRYFHEPSPSHTKTGALHNRACELAQGDIILQWDDDDWQSPDRIVRQVATLQSLPTPGFCFTSQFYWYHLAERRACRARSWDHGGSAGATFAYHRKTWEACPFRDVDQGEDNFFWQDHETRGTPMIDAKDPTLVVYIRHNRNGSHATSDNFTDEDTVAAQKILAVDLPFYDELSEILPLDQWNNPHARWKETLDRQQMQRFAAFRNRSR
jgi:glycosyltransferase involved in cell wall biosynthesis